MVYKMKLAEISEVELKDDPFLPHSLGFAKLHGNGNDFILIDEISRELVAESAKKRFAIACCRRNFGIGADGGIQGLCSEYWCSSCCYLCG